MADAVRDAAILAWQTKYRYWTQRPSMRRPDLKLHIGNPPFPGYVSGHATMSATASTLLAARDPANANRYDDLARDATNSRLFGGVHPPSDNDFGQQLGQKVALAHMGKDYTQTYEENAFVAVDYVVVSTANAILDKMGVFSYAIDRLSTNAPRFERIAENDPAQLPLPTPKNSPPSAYEAFLGAIAIRDLDHDGDGDVLVSGYQEARLYENLGNFNFSLRGAYNHPELVGAFFTHDDQGHVSGIIAIGYDQPLWFPRDANRPSIKPACEDNASC
ncbi:MAG: hypothetical protein AAF213_08525 [Pseudomonadota bacterium]